MTKDNIRISTIQDIKKIQKWMLDAENAGVTNFDWMFERDSEGNLGRHYISAINYAEYDLAYKKFEESLNEKYGENPQGTELYNKTVEKREWVKANTEIVKDTRVPKKSLYENNTYYNLSDTHKKILNDFLNIKSIFDRRYESADIATNKVIQIRKNAIQRIADSSNSASSLYQNAKNALNESLKDTADDNVVFGETKTGLKNFDGSEYLMLPMLYVKDLENPNEVSTDVVRSLMCYAYSTNNYSGLSNIINPLEIGRVIINEVREVQETRGGQKLIERLKSNGVNISNPITKKNGSNIADRYKDYLESQVYQRYLKDEGVIGNTKLNISKTTSAFLQYSSAVQLGFNWLANIANVTTGIAMQNIEAAASEFYNAKELFLADKEYAKNIASLVAELPSRVKTNKLSLFGEMFNIKQDYEKDIKRVQKKNLLGRIFGSSIQFLGQEGGDHWLYYRTAIAMCIRIKVLVPGKGEMSLWDALTIENVYKGRDDIKIMKLPKGTTYSDGKPIDINKIGRQIANINQHLFGIYNEDDANAANRLALGRLLMQYRKWMKPQLNKRFMSKQYNITLDKDQEGYYRTLLRIALELKRGKYQLGSLKEQLNEAEKSNINRALFELLQFYIVLSLTKFVDWGDDEKRPWVLKLLEYIAQRSVHELGALTVASPKHFIQENLKTIKTPMPSISIIDNSLKAIGSIFSHHDRTHILQSGPYKGMTILEKNFYKAPIPGLSQYRSLDKFFDDIESSTEYYMRTY